MTSEKGVEYTKDFLKEVGAEMGEEERADSFRRELEVQYEKRNEIDKGKAAEIWYGDWPLTEDPVCLKTNYNPKASVNDIAREYALQQKFREAGVRVAKPWLHADLSIQGKDDQTPVERGIIAMEVIDGSTLEQFILDMQEEGKQLTVDEYRMIEKDLKEQIEIAHKAGLYHRDLHLRNVMLDKDLRIHLIDFGDAAEAESQLDESTIYQTETARDGKVVTIRFPQDENILKEFSQELIKRNLIDKKSNRT